MSDSSNRTDQGLPPPSHPPSEPVSDEALAWDTPQIENQCPTQTTEADLILPGLNPKSSGSDNQPTIISRAPLRSNDDVMNSLRGRRLAHFELIAPIGVGGMAAVIKGRDLQLDRTVALKILPPDMALDPENVRRFHHEARAAAKLDHENIARVFFYGEDQRLHFIAFEFVQGDNLRVLVERRGRLPVGEAVHYILQVATGLAHAAGRGVVHRDIKPSNIIITPNGRAKLVDMGLARSLIPQDDKQLTQSGVTLGTFDYISPEQAMEPREADVRSDIYSLGCTFYHILTGQPPVPEGTAAKKLHHHQHELPIDPRQLNPEVPDEVAAILGKMMAKNPRDRYQKPEVLVEQLLHVAQKLDSGSERPDGLLYVDAPLPTRPTRPLFLITLAIAAVVALIFALDQPPRPRPSLPATRTLNGNKQPDNKAVGETPPKVTDKTEPQRDLPGVQANGGQPAKFDYDGENGVEALQKFANDHRAGTADLKVVLHKNLDLTGVAPLENNVGIRLRGRRIEFEAAPGKRPTISLRYGGARPENALTTALQFAADEVRLTGLRVVLNAVSAVRMTAVHLVGGIKHDFRDCVFIQRFPSYNTDSPMASLYLDNGESTRNPPLLTLDRCAFVGEEGSGIPDKQPDNFESLEKIGRGGDNAIVQRGEGSIEARDCVFGPHRACFRFTDKSKADPHTELKLRHCSVLLADGSAVFHLDPDAGANAWVEYCLFSRPETRSAPTTHLKARLGAILIRQDMGEGQPTRYSALFYRGTDNRYHNLDGFWGDLPSDDISARDWKSFLNRVETSSGGDLSSHALRSTNGGPWDYPDPLEELRKLDLRRAFRVKQNVQDLRVVRRPHTDLIGAQFCDREPYINGKLPPLLDEKAPEARRKIVDPTLAQSENSQYPSLAGALIDAQDGDEILLKMNGRQEMPPIILEKASLNVTLKPYEGFRPLLTLRTSQKDSALFTLHDGRIRFEKLDFLLEPSEKGFENQAVVHLAGDSRVRFENCTITLGEPLGCQLSVATLGDLGALMRPPIKQGEIVSPGPDLEFERCVIRGKGDLLWCKASRPFRFLASHTLVTLAGSVVLINGSESARTLPGPGVTDPGPRSVVTLKHVTTALSAPLIHLRALREIKSLVPLKVQPSNCLFAPLGSKPLVVLSDLDSKPSDMDVRERVLWGGEGGKNAYGPFANFIEQQVGGVGMMPRRSFDRDLKDYTGETESKFLDAVRFPEAIDTTALHRAKPAHFAVPDLVEYGAKVEDLPDPNLSRDDMK